MSPLAEHIGPWVGVLRWMVVALLGMTAAARGDPRVFVEDLQQTVPATRARAFLEKSASCALWIGASHLEDGDRVMNPWVVCLWEGRVASGTVNERRGCIVGVYALHRNRYAESAVEPLMREGEPCTPAVVGTLLTRRKVDGQYPSVSESFMTNALNSVGSAEADNRIETGGRAPLVKIARRLLIDLLLRAKEPDWAYICSKRKGVFLGLKVDCSRIERGASSLAESDNIRGEKLLDEARAAYAAGDRAKARRDLRAAQKVGWNDLDLANELEKRR